MVAGRITGVVPSPTAVDNLGDVVGLVLVGLPAGDVGSGAVSVGMVVEARPTRVGVAARGGAVVPTPTPAGSAGRRGLVVVVVP